MTKKWDDKLMLAEQIFEVRYTPSGSFLDVRGFGLLVKDAQIRGSYVKSFQEFPNNDYSKMTRSK